MPRVYTKGVKKRPGENAGQPCEAEGCSTTESSGWSKGICAACRKKACGPPLADRTNLKRARTRAETHGAPFAPPIQPAEPAVATVFRCDADGSLVPVEHATLDEPVAVLLAEWAVEEEWAEQNAVEQDAVEEDADSPSPAAPSPPQPQSSPPAARKERCQLRAELAQVQAKLRAEQAKLHAERDLTQRMLARAVDVAFESARERGHYKCSCRVYDVEDATGCDFVALRSRLADMDVLWDSG